MRTHARNSICMDRMNRHEKAINDSASRDWVRDQSYIKQYNIQTVLAMLKKCQPVSRTDIARMTSMSPTSITRIVTALLNQGLIYETSGDPRSGRGRKATNLRIHSEGLYAVGVHLEKSVLRLCVTNFANETLYRVETLVDGECTPEKMAREAKALFDRMPEGTVEDVSRVGAVGVTLSGAVNSWSGMVKRSDLLGWTNEDVRSAFSDAFGITACVENDVKSCLIGEKVRMKIADEIDTVYLLIGSGIGMAATSSGILVRGEENEAGEITCIPLGRNADGSIDYLSHHLVEGHLIRRAQQHDPSAHSIDAILWAQQQGQEWADALIRGFCCHLRMTLAMIDGILNPAQIILGGSLFTRLASQLGSLIDEAHVRTGGQYEDACMVGAASIAMRAAVIQLIGQSIE